MVERVQAVVFAVEFAFAQGQEIAGFGIEDEEQAIQENQRVIVDILQYRRIMGRKDIRSIVEGTLSYVAQRIIDLLFERLTDTLRVVYAFFEDSGDTKWMSIER